MASSLQFQPAMRQERIKICCSPLAVVFLIGVCLPAATAASAVNQQPATKVANVALDRRTVANFEQRLKKYLKLRNRVKKQLPKLSKDSTPEQIAAHKKAFEAGVRRTRLNATQGDLFTADIAEYLRRLIRAEFKGRDRGEIKETILDADTSGVPLKVNYPYPETKEVSTVPPTLLLKLPQLPKEVNYRFVGPHMLLIDNENRVILDYMLNALP